MQRRRFLAGAVSGAFAGVVSGCGAGTDARRVAAAENISSENASATDITQTIRNQGLVLLNHEFYRQGNSGGVRGAVENRGEVDLDFIAAYVRFFDRSGDRVSQASDSEGAGLPVGETWQFNVQLLETDPASVARYQLVVIDKRSSEVDDPFEGATF